MRELLGFYEEQELKKLIKEQEADERRGNVQDSEPFVAFSLDGMAPMVDGSARVDFMIVEDNAIRWKKDPNYFGCAVHGLSARVIRPGGYEVCSECERIAQRKRRRNAGIERRNFCEHDWPSHCRTTPQGQRYCTICQKIRNHKRSVSHQKGTCLSCPVPQETTPITH